MPSSSATLAACAAGIVCGVGLAKLWRRSEHPNLSRVLQAIEFGARKHRDQRRKNTTQEPYINHPIRVSATLAAGGAEEDVIIAALLHDTVEDTDCNLDEIADAFGHRVADIVGEVTDDKTLPKMERKRLQIEHAPHLSREAKLIKLSDKLDNLFDLVKRTPLGWTPDRVDSYFLWAEKVIAGLRGTSADLEQRLDDVLAQRAAAVAQAQSTDQPQKSVDRSL